MNQFIATGHICQKPIFVSEDESGKKSYAYFNLAIKRRFRTEGQQDTDFIRCICFGKNAEFANKFFEKGMRAEISGEIRIETSEKDGNKYTNISCILDKLEFGAPKKSNEQENSNGGFRNTEKTPFDGSET